MAAAKNRYSQIIESIFLELFQEGLSEVPFSREEIFRHAKKLGIKYPKNVGDLIYSFRYRSILPKTISEKAPEGFEWIIQPTGKGTYKFVLSKEANYLPNPNLLRIKIPDATPGIVSRYSLDDEQALLAKIRYNRLIDIFTGVTCYSLQNHLRTTIKEIGQVETDEIYVGIDKQGIHYVFTVQAKVGKDKIGAVQLFQDFSLCKEKFPNAIGRPIAAQFMDNNTIALFEFVMADDEIKILTEKQYILIPSTNLSDEEIMEYRKHLSN